MFFTLGVVGSSFGRGEGSGSNTSPTLTLENGIVTATYVPLVGELNKQPYIDDVVITTGTTYTSGETLTATVTGRVNGSFIPTTHEYQWYRLNGLQEGTLTEIAGATSQTYVLTNTDVGGYVTCKARFVHIGGTNNKSEWLYSNMTSQIQPAPDGDIQHAWEDFFDIETGLSVPANWNTAGVSPSLINLGTGADWTTVEATKPVFSTNKLVFTNAHRITGTVNTYPPVFEVWYKLRFTGAGTVLALGNNTLFGADASNNYQSNGMANQAGNQLEHVFRVVSNGINSKFQVDKGAVVTFDEGTTSATTLVMGQTNNGSSPGDFEIKRFQRTADGTVLTDTEVAAKWLYHGF